MSSDNESEYHVDVAIVGGAFSGSALALLLKRSRPDTRILVIEKSTEFDKKVGESISEVAGCFLTRILGLSSYLGREHILKHGLRLWFNGEGNECPGRCSEVGALFQSRLATFQLDRSRFDEHLAGLVEESGCELWRPATVRSFALRENGGEESTLEVTMGNGGTRNVRARWVIDASGKAAWLSRKRGNVAVLESHPVNAVWARFVNTGDLDSLAAREMFRQSGGNQVYCGRGAATNHLMGDGWWCWIIPLSDGEVSAGLVYDSRLFEPPEGDTPAERLHRHLVEHPVGRLLFGEAEPVPKDTRAYNHLPYYSTKVAGDGWVVVGDAAGFIDPLYSQGLDYCSHTVYAAHRILLDALNGACVKEALRKYDEGYRESYRRWYEALYRDKYHYLGDAELMTVAFLLDLASYFIGPVRLVYENPEREFALMPYDGPVGKGVARFMAFYNGRLAVLARKRKLAGVYGSSNLDCRHLVPGFTPDRKVLRLLFKGLRLWGACELKGLFHPRLTCGVSSDAKASSRSAVGDVRADGGAGGSF